MEEQVTASKQPGAYYVDSAGPRYENPAEFSAATQGQEIPQPPQAPPMPNFELMRQMAMKQAIEQIQAQRAAQPPAPQPAPFVPQPQPQPQYIPQPAPTAQVTEQVTEQVRIVRRNLTRPELLAVFVVACIAVTGTQALWNFTTNLLPRIEIRAK